MPKKLPKIEMNLVDFNELHDNYYSEKYDKLFDLLSSFKIDRVKNILKNSYFYDYECDKTFRQLELVLNLTLDCGYINTNDRFLIALSLISLGLYSYMTSDYDNVEYYFDLYEKYNYYNYKYFNIIKNNIIFTIDNAVLIDKNSQHYYLPIFRCYPLNYLQDIYYCYLYNDLEKLSQIINSNYYYLDYGLRYLLTIVTVLIHMNKDGYYYDIDFFNAEAVENLILREEIMKYNFIYKMYDNKRIDKPTVDLLKYYITKY